MAHPEVDKPFAALLPHFFDISSSITLQVQFAYLQRCKPEASAPPRMSHIFTFPLSHQVTHCLLPHFPGIIQRVELRHQLAHSRRIF
jgi:hypothetical protein